LSRFLNLVLVTMVLGGCSQFKMLYSLGSEAIQSEAEFYLILTWEEEAALARSVANLALWHRTDMLPRYAAFLQETAARFNAGPLDTASVEATVALMRGLLEKTVEGASPFVADVLVSHTAPRKVAYLRDRLDKRLAERRAEEKLARVEWISERTKKSVGRFEHFLGEITPTQEAIVRRYFDDIADTSATWQKMREKRQKAFTDFLAQQPDRESIARFVPRILLRSAEIVGPNYKVLADAWWKRVTGWMSEMAASMSQAQREHLVGTLRAYANDMIDLSA